MSKEASVQFSAGELRAESVSGLLIWHRGEIIPEDALWISVLDRTFEHGLGLFETFRTWNGKPALFERHLERMRRSARELGLPIEPGQLPDVQAVLNLIDANRASLIPDQDVRIRLTLSGGLSTNPASATTLWMTVGPLPPPAREPGAVITHTLEVSEADPLARHKTLNYWRKRLAQDQAARGGSDDALCLTPAGLICETCRANVFLIEGRRLSTPDLAGPLLPGVMRAIVLERARRFGLEIREEPLPREKIATADEVFVTNSLRGMLPVARILDRELAAPGPVTRDLWNEISRWLAMGGPTT